MMLEIWSQLFVNLCFVVLATILRIQTCTHYGCFHVVFAYTFLSNSNKGSLLVTAVIVYHNALCLNRREMRFLIGL